MVILSAKTDQSPPKLLDQLRAAIRTRHYSLKTEIAYTYKVLRRVGAGDFEHSGYIPYIQYELTGVDFSRCPQCQRGQMHIIKRLDPRPHAPPQ